MLSDQSAIIFAPTNFVPSWNLSYSHPLGRGFGADIVGFIAFRLLSFKKCCVTNCLECTEKVISWDNSELIRPDVKSMLTHVCGCMAGSTSEEINLCNLNLRVFADLCLLIHKRLIFECWRLLFLYNEFFLWKLIYLLNQVRGLQSVVYCYWKSNNNWRVPQLSIPTHTHNFNVTG